MILVKNKKTHPKHFMEPDYSILTVVDPGGE